MSKENYIWCLVCSIAGCVMGTGIVTLLFDFGQDTGLWFPLVVGILITIQLVELVLERLGAR